MATAAVQEHQPGQRTEQIAWGVLWIAFAAFCVLAVSVAVGVYYFLNNSIIPMSSTLHTSRGTIGVRTTDLLELVVRDDRSVSSGEAITTSADTQGVLVVTDDGLGENQGIMTITFRGDSRGMFVGALRPRFSWGVEPYRVTLDAIDGDLDIWISPDVPRAIQVTLSAPSGDYVFIDRPGEYSVSARDDRLSVVTLQGAALLVADDRARSATEISAGSRGVLSMTSNEIVSLPGYIDLLGDFAFSADTVISADANTPSEVIASPLTWICFNPPDAQDPPGSYLVETVDGRSAVRLRRSEGATTHGETRCTQRFGPGSYGVDISGYNYLAVRATFRVEGQSLAVCGIAGSECPLMLNMQYVPAVFETSPVTVRDATAYGSIFDPLRPSPARSWRKGFYVLPRGQFDAPVRCDTCLQEHSLLRASEWYTYNSGNLLTPFAPEDVPRYLLNFSFYASGHEYDVYVSEIMLLVGNVETG